MSDAPQPPGSEFALAPIPTLAEAYGWGFDNEVPPSVKLGVAQAADTLANFRGTIQQGVTNQWATAAVNTDALATKIGASIAGQVQTAGVAATGLQHPVAMATLAPLSHAVEAAATLGAVPPMPGSQQNVPPCVSIRAAGVAGDIGPAIEAYRDTVFNQRFTRGQQYVDTITYIKNCLPPDGPTREAFAATVLQLQSLPENAAIVTTPPRLPGVTAPPPTIANLPPLPAVIQPGFVQVSSWQDVLNLFRSGNWNSLVTGQTCAFRTVTGQCIGVDQIGSGGTQQQVQVQQQQMQQLHEISATGVYTTVARPPTLAPVPSLPG